MPTTQRHSVVVAVAVLLLLAISGCTLAGANPAPLTPVSPGDVENFEPLEPEAEDNLGVIPTPSPLAPVDDLGTQTAQAPLGEQPAGEATVPPEGATQPPAEAVEPTQAPVAEATPVPAAPGDCPITYTIEQGDTLFSLALQYGVTVEQIVAASNLADADELDLGQQITIPCPDGTAAQPAGESGAEGGDIVYVVQPGDNLFRIALQYERTVEELAAYNNIADPTQLDVGQRILIPQD